MVLKWIFDRMASLLGLLFLWPVLLIVAILVKVKMPGGITSMAMISTENRKNDRNC